MIRSFFFAAALLTASPALAQAPAAVPSVDAAAEATARAEGDALLAAAKASEFFSNESAGGAIVLRHKPSGYRCVLNPGKPANRVTVFPHPKPGHNVGCTTQTITDSRSFYITEVPAAPGAEQAALELAVAGIRERFSDARPAGRARNASPAFSLPPGMTLPKARVAVFSRGQGDERVDVGQRGDWQIKYRYSTAPGVGAEGGPLDMFWPLAVLEAERWRAANPVAAPGVEPASADASQAPTPVPLSRPDAERAIELADAQGLFRVVEKNGEVTLRHDRSGLVCGFATGSGGLVVGAAGPRGDDVGCRAVTIGGPAVHTRVQRVGRGVNLDRALGKAVAEVRGVHAGLRPEGKNAVTMMTGDRKGARSIPAHRTAVLRGQAYGAPAYVRISAAAIGEWLVTETTFNAPGDQLTADLTGELGFVGRIMAMSEPAQP